MRKGIDIYILYYYDYNIYINIYIIHMTLYADYIPFNGHRYHDECVSSIGHDHQCIVTFRPGTKECIELASKTLHFRSTISNTLARDSFAIDSKMLTSVTTFLLHIQGSRKRTIYCDRLNCKWTRIEDMYALNNRERSRIVSIELSSFDESKEVRKESV